MADERLMSPAIRQLLEEQIRAHEGRLSDIREYLENEGDSVHAVALYVSSQVFVDVTLGHLCEMAELAKLEEELSNSESSIWEEFKG